MVNAKECLQVVVDAIGRDGSDSTERDDDAATIENDEWTNGERQQVVEQTEES